MKLPALAIAATLVTSGAYAENIIIGCPLIRQYSEDQVQLLLNQARSVISEQEVGKIYYRYVSLKNACQANNNASRVVSVSPTLRNWLNQYGINISKVGRQL
jgi:hypothetical protein